MNQELLIVAGIVAVLLFFAGILFGHAIGRKGGRMEAEHSLPGLVAQERSDAVRRSRSVIEGQVAEQLAPWLPDFPFDPGDVRFIGKPVDFIAFKGSSTGKIEEVAFVEVKTGTSGLSGVERSLRDAIEEGRVAWYEYRL